MVAVATNATDEVPATADANPTSKKITWRDAAGEDAEGDRDLEIKEGPGASGDGLAAKSREAEVPEAEDRHAQKRVELEKRCRITPSDSPPDAHLTLHLTPTWHRCHGAF